MQHTQTLPKHSVFLRETLANKKNGVLDFLDKGTRHPVWEPMSFFGIQEHATVTEITVGLLTQPFP